jgi:hypothetical protein
MAPPKPKYIGNCDPRLETIWLKKGGAGPKVGPEWGHFSGFEKHKGLADFKNLANPLI